MTRRDYMAFCAAISKARTAAMRGSVSDTVTAHEILDMVVLEVAHFCAADNPHFDRGRFLHECGMPR